MGMRLFTGWAVIISRNNRMRSRGGLAALLLLLAATGRAGAAPPADERQDLTPTARELSDRGLRQYQQGQLDAAIESFMEAFALSDNTGLLFNVAQAYRLKGDCALAGEYYRRYLAAAPASSLRPSIERRVAEMDQCVRARAGAPLLAPRAPVAAAVAVAPPPSSQEPAPASTRRALIWTLRGSTAALLASSAVFGVLAWDAKRDFDATAFERPATRANDRYVLDTTLALSFAASGLACAVASYLVGR